MERKKVYIVILSAILILGGLTIILGGCLGQAKALPFQPQPPWNLTEAEWKEKLTPEQYYILREKGTEKAYTGKYWDSHDAGTYVCAGCALPLFSSETKYDSKTGWPSFWEPIDPNNVYITDDWSFLMKRQEVLCHRCAGHLGHVFDDGPPPTGKRYCINSPALDFYPRVKN